MKKTKKKELTCDGCSDCCKYIATEIDKPKTKDDIDNIIWFLHHRNVRVYIDWDNDWYLEFMTKCRQLNSKGLCQIYTSRPKMCKDYKHKDCTKHNSDPAEKFYFKSADDFEKYLKNRKTSPKKKIKRLKITK